MEEEDITGGSTGAGLTRSEQFAQYGLMAAYFIAIYLVCYLICRVVKWEKLGKMHAVLQGLVVLAVVAALYLGWGLHFARLADEYDMVKAAGLGFITFFVAVGGVFHGEHGRQRALRKRGAVAGPATPTSDEGEVAPEA